MDGQGHQALNLSAKNQARTSTGGAVGSSIRHSASTSALSRQSAAASSATQPSPFDLLAAFGGDINSAVTALAAANSGLNKLILHY